MGWHAGCWAAGGRLGGGPVGHSQGRDRDGGRWVSLLARGRALPAGGRLGLAAARHPALPSDADANFQHPPNLQLPNVALQLKSKTPSTRSGMKRLSVSMTTPRNVKQR